MIENNINNKKAFQIYVIINFIFYILGFLIAIISIWGIMTHDWAPINTLKPYAGFIPLLILWGLVERIIRPSYIETIISEKEIIVKTFSPNIRNGLRFILMLKYRNQIKELKLTKQEYNDYKLKIGRLGLRKMLIFQKIEKDGISETSEINISLLGQKKYTNLILSIDRMQGKINLN